MLIITTGLRLFCSSIFAAPAGNHEGLEGCSGGLTPTSCSQQVQLCAQTRLLRVFSFWVLEKLKGHGLHSISGWLDALTVLRVRKGFLNPSMNHMFNSIMSLILLPCTAVKSPALPSCWSLTHAGGLLMAPPKPPLPLAEPDLVHPASPHRTSSPAPSILVAHC